MVNLVEVRRRLKVLDTTAICDADKRTRVMSPALKCRSARRVACGPAFTVRCRQDFLAVARAIEKASAGDVIVVDGGGAETALAGELFARAALAKGVEAIIVDGGYRDMGYVATCDLAVYSRYAFPMAGTTNAVGDLQVPVTCGGVTVQPGDLVIADAEGVVVLAPDRVDALFEAALEVKRKEALVIERMDSGATLGECFNLEEHVNRLATGLSSSLSFTV